MLSFQHKSAKARARVTPITSAMSSRAAEVVAAPPGLHYTAGVVQRVVYDVNDKQKVVPLGVDEAYDLVSTDLGKHDAQDVKERIKRKIEDAEHDYDKWDVLDQLGIPLSSTPPSSTSGSIEPSRTIGEREYQLVNSAEDKNQQIYKHEGKLWRIKGTDTQRSYAEREYIGALLYAAITDHGGGDIELHYEVDEGQDEDIDDRGLIVKRHLLGYRNWANNGEELGADYDAIGLGQIALAAWFLGDEDLHGANFGTLGVGEAPKLVVVDASGALNKRNLKRSLELDDYLRIPLPPGEWDGNWDLHHRSAISPEDTTQVSLSSSVRNRLRGEKGFALRRILSLNFDAIESELASGIFLGDDSLDALSDEDGLEVVRVWKAVRKRLESRKKQLEAWIALGRERHEHRTASESSAPKTTAF